MTPVEVLNRIRARHATLPAVHGDDTRMALTRCIGYVESLRNVASVRAVSFDETAHLGALALQLALSVDRAEELDVTAGADAA